MTDKKSPFQIVAYKSDDAPADARWMAAIYLDGVRLPIAFFGSAHDKVLDQAEKHAGKEFEKHAKEWAKNAQRAADAAVAKAAKADAPAVVEEEDEPI